jgi:hypothetical protein
MRDRLWRLGSWLVILLMTQADVCYDWEHGQEDAHSSAAPCPTTHTTTVPAQPGVMRVVADTPAIKIFERSACAMSQPDQSSRHGAIRIENTYEVPPPLDQATVVLNGWDLQFVDPNVDHGIASVVAAIESVALEQRQEPAGPVLHWDVVGALGDESAREPYSLCWNYLLIAWDDRQIDATASESFYIPNLCQGGRWSDDPTNGTSGAGLGRPHWLIGWPLRFPASIAMLPRGFAFYRYNFPIKQAAFGTGQGVPMTEYKVGYVGDDGKVTVLGSTAAFVDSYIATYSVLGDLGTYFGMGTIGGAIAGTGVFPIEPPPSDADRLLVSSADNPTAGATQHRTIEQVPFTYAVPLLTGWKLSYADNDWHNVSRIGIGITGVQYEMPRLGTLSYDLTFHLYDVHRIGAEASANVSVLGFTRHALPDLVIGTPTGSGWLLPCVRDATGKLVLSVTNQGDGIAGPSRAKAVFGNDVNHPTFVDTPEIAPHSSATLAPVALPPGCVGQPGGCVIVVGVDTDDQVLERDETNNFGVGSCMP